MQICVLTHAQKLGKDMGATESGGNGKWREGESIYVDKILLLAQTCSFQSKTRTIKAAVTLAIMILEGSAQGLQRGGSCIERGVSTALCKMSISIYAWEDSHLKHRCL